MADFSVEKLSFAIEKGKVRGFEEIKKINGEDYFFQYALKKRVKNIVPIFLYT